MDVHVRVVAYGDDADEVIAGVHAKLHLLKGNLEYKIESILIEPVEDGYPRKRLRGEGHATLV